MNWYYATGIALICLTIAMPIWAALRLKKTLKTAPAIPWVSQHMNANSPQMCGEPETVTDFERHLFAEGVGCLSAPDKSSMVAVARRKLLETPSINDTVASTETTGDRIADRVARFGGSWTFILLFVGTLIAWVGLNGFLMEAQARTFDPYPFVFLNLILSMVAALQAPIILMSQNRQANRDRVAAALDYDVNLKAEIEIMAVHEKLDGLRIDHLHALVEKQYAMLEDLSAYFRGSVHRS